jgi:Secretion system C-terminal sorting domain
MKPIFYLLFCIGIGFVIAPSSDAQISNLKVGGSSSNFTITSGDTINWSYDVSPVGATTIIEIWYDVNGNGVIDPGTDVLWQALSQTDGVTNGNGPPDTDGQANGVVNLVYPVGLAPGKYVLKFTEGGTSLSIAGTVNHLSSPAHTISGTITPPTGKSAANIFVEAHRSEQYAPNFWDAITDESGNYSIEMTADTAGNPWSVRVETNPYLPSIVTPAEQDLNITGNLTGINFSIVAAAAQVDGYVKDEDGNILVNQSVSLSSSGNSNSYVSYSASTDGNGLFRIGVQSQDLSATTWMLQAFEQQDNGQTVSQLDAVAQVPSLSFGDSVLKNLTVYNVNSEIQGTIKIDGANANFPIQITATNQDTAGASAWSDGSTGNFTIPVSNKIFNYTIDINLQNSPYSFTDVIAHPGDTGVIINLTTTGVKDHESTLPKQFDLGQNYPNPFNPTTEISYQLPKNSFVSLKIYNMLGQEVETLVSGSKAAGSYTARLDGARLSSGIYFYTLKAGNFTSTKKMLLLK